MAQRRPEAPARELSRRKKLLLVSVATLLALLFAELGTRAYFALEIGPRTLLYGTSWFRNEFPDELESQKQDVEMTPEDEATREENTVRQHRNRRAGYAKYFPGEVKTTRDVDTEERITVEINSHGFRGPEFELQKPPGVVRVLTLGASSTFGYYNRDHETYPAQLQRILNERRRDDRRFEVINLGVPHSSSANVAALFLAEGLPLQPDFVTYYQGRNDSHLPEPPATGIASRVHQGLIRHLLLAALIDQAVVGERVSLTAASKKFEPFAASRTEFYLGNLTRIADACAEHGIHFVVANQQATGYSGLPRKEQDRLPLRGVTYRDETDAIRKKMAAGETFSSFEYSLLVHERLQEALKAWAVARGLPFVDVIEVLDQRRDLLLSWVHLHPEANRMIAAALADRILEIVYP